MSSAEEILQKVKTGELSIDDAQEQLKTLKLSDLKKLTYKASPKGAISFYGIRRMPITLYQEELNLIVNQTNTPEFKKFLTDNANKLVTKGKKEKD